MAWKIKYSERALKSLQKMDRQHAKRILTYLERRIAVLDNPRISGRPLKGELGVFWRYRIGDYRLLCEIQDEALTILVALIGHRKEIYDQ